MNNIDAQYRTLIKDILENGVLKEDRTGVGTMSVFGRTIRHSLKDGFPIITLKRTPFKTILTELLWFLNGKTNIKFLIENNCHIWDGDAYKNFQLNNKDDLIDKNEFIKKIKEDNEFAEKWGEMGPIYGKQWRKWQGYVPYGNFNQFGSVWHDQLAVAAFQLKINPDSRRLIVNSWNPNDLDQMVLPPCHYSFQFYTRKLSNEEKKTSNGADRAISLLWNQRSADAPLGVPFNISSYAILLTIMAKYVNMVPDEIIGNFGDCHIYSNQIDSIKKILENESFSLPEIKLPESGKINEYVEQWDFDNFIETFTVNNVKLIGYKSNPKIEIPLSN